MAIDLFCYTSYSAEDLRNILGSLREKVDASYEKKFIVSAERDASQMHREISLEYGLEARSFFLIRVNENDAVEDIPELVNIVKDLLGHFEICILLENEKMV